MLDLQLLSGFVLLANQKNICIAIWRLQTLEKLNCGKFGENHCNNNHESSLDIFPVFYAGNNDLCYKVITQFFQSPNHVGIQMWVQQFQKWFVTISSFLHFSTFKFRKVDGACFSGCSKKLQKHELIMKTESRVRIVL